MLQEKILKSLKKLNLDQRRLAKIAGTNESCLSRYLNGFEELHFSSILKIVQYLFPDQEKEVMSEYVVTQKSRNARFALEYCDMNSLSEPRKYVIEKLAASSNPVDREWATLYSLMFAMKNGTLSLHTLLSQVELFAPKEIEMKIMKTIVKAYIYERQKEFAMQIEQHVNQIEPFIKQVKSKFLRNCFNVRLGLLMNYRYLYNNNLEQARYYSNLVLDQDFFKSIKAIAYHHLGHSYLFEDYDKSECYLQKAISIFDKFNQNKNGKIARRKLLYLKAYWKKDCSFEFELQSYCEKSDYIYYLIQQDQKDQAKVHLDQTDLGSLGNWDKAFHYFYEGLINQKKETFYQSIKLFQLSRDLFHIRLPIQELLKLGEDKEVLEVWSN